MGKAELQIEIDEGVLEQARAAGIDLDSLAEHAIRAALAALDGQGPTGIVANAVLQAANPEGPDARARRWAEENAEAIRLYEERIKKYGVFGEDFRTW